MKTTILSVVALVLGLSAPATATTTYTYDIDYDYPILRQQGSGFASRPTINRPGRGNLSGTVTFADSYTTNYRLLSWDLTSVNTATGFSATNRFEYSSSDPTGTYSSSGAPGAFQQVILHTMGTTDGSVGCSAGLIAPSGQHQGRQYALPGGVLRFDVDVNFTPGDAQLFMGAVELFGRAPLCFGNGFADLGYEHTYISRTGAGTLRQGGDDIETSPIPVPAGLPLLLAGLGGLAMIARRRNAQAD